MNELARYHEREIPVINSRLRELTSGLNGLVVPVVDHVLAAGGKRLRPLLTALTARAFKYEGDVYPLACSLEFLHSATLLHDDILDGAELRRGRPSAHTLFGSTKTILAGDALLALANRIVAEYETPELTRLLSQALLSTATGEIMEIAHLRDTDMTFATYIEIITGKTAYLIEAACRCGAVLAQAPKDKVEAAGSLGLNLGIAFQLVDDVLDYTTPPHVSGKPSGADLREGKITLPLIMYLQSLPENERIDLSARFRQDALDGQALEDLRAEIVARGFAEKTRIMAAQYVEDAKKALDAFPDAPETGLLAQAVALMSNREK